MAYRIESNKTPKEMMENLYDFLTTAISIDEPDYSSSAGNGNLVNLHFDKTTATSETWTLQCTDESAGTFSVQGSISGIKADATVGTAYDNGIMSFTLTAGTQTFLLNDIVNITMYTNLTTPFTPLEYFKGSEFNYYKYGTDISISGTNGRRMLPAPDGTNSAISEGGQCVQANFITSDYTVGDSYTYLTSVGTQNVLTTTDFTVNMWVKNLTSGVNLTQPHGDNYSGATGQYNKIGFSITADDIRLTRGTNSSMADYTTFLTGLKSKLLANNINVADWMSFTFVVNRATSTCKVFVNDILLETVVNSYFAVNHDFFMTVLISRSRANNGDQYWGGTVWKRQLSDIEAKQIYTDKGVEQLNDYSQTMMFQGMKTPPTFLLKYKSGYLKMAIQHNMCMYGQYLQNLTFNYSPSLLGVDNVALSNGGQSANYYHNSPTNFYGLMPDFEANIEKYWFVTDGETIIINWKIFDPSTSQSNPVYQTYYIGITEGIDYQKAVPDFYGTRDGVDVWTTTSTSFRFGALFTQNYVRYNNAISSWVRSRTNTGSTSYPTNFDKINLSENSIPLSRLCARGEYYISNYYANGSSAAGYGGQYYETVLKHIYQAPKTSLVAEDYLIIDGTKYVILQDCNRTDSTAMFALKLFN